MRPITPPPDMAIGPAISAYLATLFGPEQCGTRTVYRSTLRALAAELSPDFAVSDLDNQASVERLTDWFTAQWANRAPEPARHADPSPPPAPTPTSSPSPNAHE